MCEVKEQVAWQHLNRLSDSARREKFSIVVKTLEALLGSKLDAGELDFSQFGVFLDSVEKTVLEGLSGENSTPGGGETLQMMRALSPGKANSIRGFVCDMAEIIIMEREDRSEYVLNRSAFMPYKIGKLLLEYAIKSVEIDEIVGVLTKGYCAKNCDRLPVGCCSILGYDLNLVTKTMLRMQELEARRKGHQFPVLEEKCKYHTIAGCTIALFKSPACVGYLCDPLIDHLKEEYPPLELQAFFDRLAAFRNCYLDRSEIFEKMDALILSGRNLI
jgi:hypothetical protein